jgi:hypothetical protein
MDVRFPRERGLIVAGKRDQLSALPLEHRNDGKQLGAFSRVGQRDQDVVPRHHAEIPVACFRGMDEECRRAGACESGGDLARDVAGFPNAAYHHAAATGQDELRCLDKARVQTRDELGNRPGLDFQHLAGHGYRIDRNRVAQRYVHSGGV